eukprot:UN24711
MIIINGQDVSLSQYRRGYVEQFDTHENTMTVRESVYFSGRLRNSGLKTDKEINELVDKIIMICDLENISNKIIGEVHQGGITKAERKKLNIAVELVVNPSILLLDEPVTGLADEQSAESLMLVLKTLSTKIGIICTIHQPTEKVFYCFDYVNILSKNGESFYFGEVEKAEALLEKRFRPRKDREKLADFLIFASEKADIDTVKQFEDSEHFKSLTEKIELLNSEDTKHKNKKIEKSEIRVSIFTEYKLLFNRAIKKRLRKRGELFVIT